MPRCPALPLAVAVGLGIVAAQCWSYSVPVWLCGTAAALGTAITCCLGTSRRAAAAAVLIFGFALGGLREREAWSLRSAEDIAQYVHGASQPARMIGTLRSAPRILPARHDPFVPEWMRVDRSVCELACTSLGSSGEARTNVTGLVRLTVDGHLLHADVGDRVEVIGRLSRPAAPKNPGRTDYRAWLRQQGIDLLFEAEHPDAVRRLAGPQFATEALAQQRSRLRRECTAILSAHLSGRTRAVGLSLLLGDRTQITDEIRTAFADSGTMHLLAISGLNVAILGGLVFVVCRVLNLSTRLTTPIVLLAIAAHAVVTDHQPPVLRATVLAFIVVAGQPWGRRAPGLNSIALCALGLMLWHPADLFDIGAQLSFLAVAAISWAAQVPIETIVAGWWFRSTVVPPEPGPLRRWLALPFRWLLRAHFVTAAVWLFTLPLTAAAFHLVSPVGFLINVVLIPYTTLVLACGYVTLLTGLLVPGLVRVPALAYDGVLRPLLTLVEWSAKAEGGHIALAGPGPWWLSVFYLLLGWGTGVLPLPRNRIWAWRGLAVWLALGAAAMQVPGTPAGLRCTILAMGHGAAVLLELPNGRTLLYDVGTLGDGRRARLTVESAVWARHIPRLDAVVLSHADIDHFNGLPELLAIIPVGQVLVGQSFLDFRQPGVVELCETASRCRVPIHLLQAGDRLVVDSFPPQEPQASPYRLPQEQGEGSARVPLDVRITVQHPPGRGSEARDNANSVVLRVEYAGRSLLLMGDLEGRGLATLLELPPQQADVLLAPHHGSRAANTAALAAWAQPQVVVASASRSAAGLDLQGVYGTECRVLSTDSSGAVTVTISPTGDLSVEEFLESAVP